jgi:aromatic ring-opening dioxygenase catalytic subunit (LigB family)
LSESAQLGWAMRQAVEQDYDGKVAFFASGSLSHRFAQNGLAPEYANKMWSQAEVVTPYFPSSGTGQINVVFPVTPVKDETGHSLHSLNLQSLKDPAAVYAAGASRL